MNKYVVGALTGAVLLAGGLWLVAAATPALPVQSAAAGGSGLQEGEGSNVLLAGWWWGGRPKGGPAKKPRPAGPKRPHSPGINKKSSLEPTTDGTLLASLSASVLWQGDREALAESQQEESCQILATC